jgi:hypothetical protein
LKLPRKYKKLINRYPQVEELRQRLKLVVKKVVQKPVPRTKLFIIMRLPDTPAGIAYGVRKFIMIDHVATPDSDFLYTSSDLNKLRDILRRKGHSLVPMFISDNKLGGEAIETWI